MVSGRTEGSLPESCQSDFDVVVHLKKALPRLRSCFYNCPFGDAGVGATELNASNFLVTGDFNAHSPEWGDKKLDRRGRYLSSLIHENNYRVILTSGSFTFHRNGKKSKIDIAFAPTDINNKISTATVLKENSESDHLYLEYKMNLDPNHTRENHIKKGKPLWKLREKNKDRFIQELTKEINHKINMGQIGINNTNTEHTYNRLNIKNTVDKIEEQITCLQTTINQVCDKTLGQPKNFLNKQENYWWNEDIKIQRKTTNNAKRRYSKILSKRGKKNHPEAIQAWENLRMTRRNLKYIIQKSKAKAWDNFINELRNDPWGKPYQTIRNFIKEKKRPPNITKDTAMKTIDVLFPKDITEEKLQTKHQGIMDPELIEQELNQRRNFTTLPNGDIINTLTQELFKFKPTTEKEIAKIVNDMNNKKAPGLDGINTPICKAIVQSHTALITNIINTCLRTGYFPTQWKKQKLYLIKKPNKPDGIPNSYRPLALLKLRHSPSSHSSHKHQEGSHQKIALCTPGHSGYDVALVATGKNLDKLTTDISSTISIIEKWMSTKGLELAKEKTEVVSLNRKRIPSPLQIELQGNVKLTAVNSLGYLGVHLEKKNYTTHIKTATTTAIKAANYLARLTPNIGGPGSRARFLYYYVYESMILYAASTWHQAIKLASNRRLLQQTQKLALARVVRAYRTTPLIYLNAITGIPNIIDTIKERHTLANWELTYLSDISHKTAHTTTTTRKSNRTKKIINYNENSQENIQTDPLDKTQNTNKQITETSTKQDRYDLLKIERKDQRVKERKKTLEQLQATWDANYTDKILYNWIPTPSRWHLLKRQNITHYTIQVLTGHDIFAKYLHRINKCKFDQCWYGCNVTDSSSHTILYCKQWNDIRDAFCKTHNVKQPYTIKSFSEVIHKSDNAWKDFQNICHIIIKEKQQTENERQREERKKNLQLNRRTQTNK
ncbi:uncharacterized protein LOC143212414 [Lasioglossum baleicum]|uniref:uncharacterized protein LOC143212414 n=1 Tax=Lasioglossum baleicum TaxID=434251 RepID=UPI003FCD0906